MEKTLSGKRDGSNSGTRDEFKSLNVSEVLQLLSVHDIFRWETPLEPASMDTRARMSTVRRRLVRAQLTFQDVTCSMSYFQY